VSVLSAPEFSALALPTNPPPPGQGRAGTTVVVLGLDEASADQALTLLSRWTGPLDRIVVVSQRHVRTVGDPDEHWCVDEIIADPAIPASWISVLDLETDTVVVVSSATLPVGPWMEPLLSTLAEQPEQIVQPVGNFGHDDQVIDIELDPTERTLGLQVRAWFLAGQALDAHSAKHIGTSAFALHSSALMRCASSPSWAALRASLASTHPVRTVPRSLLYAFDAETLGPDGVDFKGLATQTARHLAYLRQRWLAPGSALVIAAPTEVVTLLEARDWHVTVGSATSVPDQLDALEPRPTLVVVGRPDIEQLELADVVTIGVDLTSPSVDAAGPVAELGRMLDELDRSATFGSLMQQCRVALDSGDVATALTALDSANALRPNAAQVLNAMAVCSVVLENFTEAAALVQAALRQAPNYKAACDNAAALGIES
jgi:hypothetical protein